MSAFRQLVVLVLKRTRWLTMYRYGLYASVYTKDIDRALRFAKGLEAGTVGVNCTSPVTGEGMPFGGCM